MKWSISLSLLFWVLGHVDSLRFQNRGSSTKEAKSPKRRNPLSYQRPPRYDSGGNEGRLTSSLTGFGMGLGTGLTIGYGPDTSGLKKPKPIQLPHEHQQDFELNHPATCVKANSINYLKNREQRGAFDIDESTVACQVMNNMNESSCYGKLSITEVNLTSADPNILGYEIKIIKGCGDKDLMEMELRALSYRYDNLRRCWVSPIEREETQANNLLTDAEFLNFIQQKSSITDKTRVRIQSEICFCEGDYCNHGGLSAMSKGLWAVMWICLLLANSNTL